MRTTGAALYYSRKHIVIDLFRAKIGNVEGMRQETMWLIAGRNHLLNSGAVNLA